jgi:DNA primase
VPSLVDLIGASIKLTRRGSLYFASCPFHNEKTASFVVYPAPRRKPKPFWRCYGCGETGDAADWIMRTQSVGYVEAKRILGEEPAKPDPAILAARQAEQRRQAAIRAYRDRAPDCLCPDWLIAT